MNSLTHRPILILLMTTILSLCAIGAGHAQTIAGKWSLVSAKLVANDLTTGLQHDLSDEVPRTADQIGQMIELRPDNIYVESITFGHSGPTYTTTGSYKFINNRLELTTPPGKNAAPELDECAVCLQNLTGTITIQVLTPNKMIWRCDADGQRRASKKFPNLKVERETTYRRQ